MNDQSELFVKMILMAWETQNARTTKFFNSLSDAQLLSEVSPGRNRGIYLLGHLIAVNDSLLAILGLGEKQFPQYEYIFLTSPDKSGIEMPGMAELKENWNISTQRLRDHFKKLTVAEWFQKHMAVSEADFAKEPHRNRLNVLITRISHEAYHHGQVALLQKKGD